MDSAWIFVVFAMVAVMWGIVTVLSTNREIDEWQKRARLMDENFLRMLAEHRQQRNTKVHK